MNKSPKSSIRITEMRPTLLGKPCSVSLRLKNLFFGLNVECEVLMAVVSNEKEWGFRSALKILARPLCYKGGKANI